ncbi:NAD-dependent succinate-semialdehyde dehydrogenase [Agrobacterium rosae]|uniref:NAD-dependent succinate-semialdehyde dehydrogenase n=1 Tax=Agrobacterium rosae TaxID=1972867 RepID=A0AAW9FFP8_9HYPH|nr:NAD-dependent succinate-semialdehyde dehydrogenase [Agrobacterium rosae]MDX8305432.1 NAD-dependent succinate-semialdehyde dehydrogenase [Agrobacterium rosae]
MNIATKKPSSLSFDVSSLPTGLFIDGEWRNGGEGKTIDVLDPSTGDVIVAVADATINDAMEAVAAAYRAADGWAATPPRERSEILRSCFELMIERKDMLAELISLENGKTLADAQGEVAYAAEYFRWFAEEAVRLNGEISTAPSGANKILVEYKPIGVAVLVTPWNFPAAMATRKVGPALAAGCTCVLKPATETPLTALVLAALYKEAGVPDGVVNVVTTSKSAPAVSAMLNDRRVRKLSFTGSTEVGRVLLREAANTVVSCSMELGGNAPFIVFNDADIDAAIEGAMIAKMRNGGEACTAANRFYVQSGIAKAFSDRLAERMGAMTVAAGYDKVAQCGPLINPTAVRRIKSLVDDATSRGATVLAGGAPLDRNGFFFAPTVLTGVTTDSEIAAEEIFGPVAAITTFETEDEVVELANGTEYGLISYVYTKDLARGLRVSERMDSGMVGLNRGIVSDPAAPFGGTKQSGLGREGAHHGILEYCEAKYIAVTW